jgi:hypothetical protein
MATRSPLDPPLGRGHFGVNRVHSDLSAEVWVFSADLLPHADLDAGSECGQRVALHVVRERWVRHVVEVESRAPREAVVAPLHLPPVTLRRSRQALVGIERQGVRVAVVV